MMCQSIPSVKNEALGNALDWMKWVSQVAIFPMMAALLAFLWYGEQRMDRLELGQQSRFTAEDGLEVWKAIAEQQHNYAVLHERLDAHLKQTVPSNELVKVVDYSKDQRELERRLTTMEREK